MHAKFAASSMLPVAATLQNEGKVLNPWLAARSLPGTAKGIDLVYCKLARTAALHSLTTVRYRLTASLPTMKASGPEWLAVMASIFLM